ncbi:hypothetical protein [Paraflavitalea sp. CAU 1676]|uniref:hypothetical protein n=1 Tax=Paraflavitalea sp. CAU 1676 TaxID=3032598 RepID=UPI0023DB32C5|nr:hypothetical protein [Paraflavitalea sp. CAU 1676]MDF2192755.1 hypothetical protein [Paraflavitalea sp. CAU 1676]
MGMATRVYGCIVEYGLLQGLQQRFVYDHNETVINELPVIDEYPLLIRPMFAITPAETIGAYLSYGGRIIHFGGNFKSFEYDWKEWKRKFEDLLTKLLWTEADVHFQTEYSDIQTFTWHIDLKKWHIAAGEHIEPIKPEYWEYEGSSFWENINE